MMFTSYTPYALTHEQARFYRSQGYYRLPNVFNQDEVAEMHSLVDQLREDKQKKWYGLYDRNKELMHRVITHPKLVGPLTSLLGPNILFVKNRHNHATINNHVGESPEGLHRDVLQPSRGLITAAIYLQDSNELNGATKIVPGSQELPYMGVPQADGGGTWLNHHIEYMGMEAQALSVSMPAGGVLLFNGLAFHGVGENKTGEERVSMTLGYRPVDELDAEPDTSRQVLVAGQYIYRGNDR